MTHGYPDFCQRMQIKVINLLLQDAYAIEDSPLLKAKMLIRKGRTIRANGIDALKECIWCLSEAISIMVLHEITSLFLCSVVINCDTIASFSR